MHDRLTEHLIPSHTVAVEPCARPSRFSTGQMLLLPSRHKPCIECNRNQIDSQLTVKLSSRNLALQSGTSIYEENCPVQVDCRFLITSLDLDLAGYGRSPISPPLRASWVVWRVHAQEGRVNAWRRRFIAASYSGVGYRVSLLCSQNQENAIGFM